MDSLTWLNLGLAVVNFAVAIFQGWKEWHSHRGAHPLQPVLIDIARAIRETRSFVDARAKP